MAFRRRWYCSSSDAGLTKSFARLAHAWRAPGEERGGKTLRRKFRGGRHDDERGRSLVQLDVGTVRLLARLTRRSATLLGLEPGRPVYAQIKGAAVLR